MEKRREGQQDVEGLCRRSMASTLYVLYLVTTNDENMLVRPGDMRVADVLVTEFMRLFNQCIKPRPVCAQGHGRKFELGSRLIP